MNKTEYIWHNGGLKPWDSCTVHILTHTLHYGSGAFEGIRLYSTDRGPVVFRLDDHLGRLFYSAGVLGMEIPYSIDQMREAVLQTVSANNLEHGYIRPIVYYGYGTLGLRPFELPVEVAVACWPWGAYLGDQMVDIKTSSWERIAPRTTRTDAKICGHYVNSILAALEIRGTKYHEALLLDSQGYIAEATAENVFIVKDGVILTPPAGSILPGITRDTVIRLADTLGIKVEEQQLRREDALLADEMFLTGTAAEIHAVRSLDDNVIGTGEQGRVTGMLKDAFKALVSGKSSSFSEFLTPVGKDRQLRQVG
ncbi:MAG: branched-chain amino acid transaminase [Candidatus Dadabacteria bacterium]|nr:MAG: branched-chain amino acid transaminase [Candidatus Dadabacteria bacterium]